MAISFDAPEEMQGESPYVNEPGHYHFIVTKVNEGAGPSGTMIDGFSFELDALGGTVEGVLGKIRTETLFMPDLSQSDKSQLAARRKLAAFFIAADLMKPSDLGKPCNIDVAKVVGRQIIIELEREMEKDTEGKYTKPTRFLRIAYSNIYHVDDPAVAKVPKNMDAFNMREAAYKHDVEYFAPLRKQPLKAKQSAPASSDFDDI